MLMSCAVCQSTATAAFWEKRAASTAGDRSTTGRKCGDDSVGPAGVDEDGKTNIVFANASFTSGARYTSLINEHLQHPRDAFMAGPARRLLAVIRTPPREDIIMTADVETGMHHERAVEL